MADWLGRYLGVLPFWLGVVVIICLGLTWFWMATLKVGREKYEWPEDKKKRLAKEKVRKDKLRNFKHNLKFKKG